MTVNQFKNLISDAAQRVIDEQQTFAGGSLQIWLDLESAQVEDGIGIVDARTSERVSQLYDTIFSSVRELHNTFEQLAN